MPNEIAQGLAVLRRMKKRVDNFDDNPSKKTKFNYQRARDCIYEDYLGPDPLYGKYFEGIFRVTRGIVERIILLAGNASPFFTHRISGVTGNPGIYPEAKVMIALK